MVGKKCKDFRINDLDWIFIHLNFKKNETIEELLNNEISVGLTKEILLMGKMRQFQNRIFLSL
jgi:hypothetical protein